MAALVATVPSPRPRSDSESSAFSNSWHHHWKVPKKTIVEEGFADAELAPTDIGVDIAPVVAPAGRRSRMDSDLSNSISELADSSEAEETRAALDLNDEMLPADAGEDADDDTVVGPIHPRKNQNQDIRAKYKEITYITNSEGRRIIEAATLEQLIRAFAEDTQGTFVVFSGI
jgi:hypothetical protein